MIRFDAVTKRYPDGTVAVDSLDLVIRSGEITVLVGPSGCGKTTTLRMVNRMIDPTSGHISLDGQDVTTIKPTTLRRGIGYVIQQGGLFPNYTVLDNIATVPRLLGWTRRAARSHALELLDKVGLDPALALRYPAQLSGGQQQRVGVARAIAADPPVLLMDEPFSAVDPVVRQHLQRDLLQLQADLHKTIVFVTHDIDEAITLGDQVAVMETGGRLAQLAPPAQLLSLPANTFVAGFVGRDRGYRALGFAAADHLPLHDEAVVQIGEPRSHGRDRGHDGWVLVIDGGKLPLGWLSTAGPDSAASDPITLDMLNLGGTLAGEEGTLREALDAALSSPSGRGVVVHQDGTTAGTVTASEVLARIESRAAHLREQTQQAEPTGTTR